MNRFDIFITYISWGSGSKKRPVLVLLLNSSSVLVYPITTQYDNKSKAVKARCFKINDWTKAGLVKQSYIDTGTLIKLPLSAIANKKPVGQLSIEDKQKLLDFLSR